VAVQVGGDVRVQRGQELVLGGSVAAVDRAGDFAVATFNAANSVVMPWHT
jgi:hypothetical protein